MHRTKWRLPMSPVCVPEALLEAGYSPLLAAILHLRGFSDPAAADAFLCCGAETLSDPLQIPDMRAAVLRLGRAIETGEHVAVYGDYDVDGITSSCMLTDYLRRRGLNCELYIPDRLTEGYGVNVGALETLRRRGVSLVVTVDCGITALREADYATRCGMELIITDHHECPDTLPRAVAVVDPRRSHGAPGQNLAGVGVAFKLLCALEGGAAGVLERYADFVAVGTVADVILLTGENRYLVRRGLEKLERDPHPGLRALLRESGLGEKPISASSIGFSLAPRLNASGRLGQVERAVALLLTEQPEEAAVCARELGEMNRDRQTLEAGIWQQAQDMIGAQPPDGPIVLAQEGWHQGVIGIAASRLTDAYNVPCVIISLDGDMGKGSCRSCGGFNIFAALAACAAWLDGFGGHAMAAGLTIKRENIAAFRAAICDYYRSHPPQDVSAVEIDLCVNSPELLTMECVEDLKRLEPCGAGNPRVTLCLPAARLAALTPIGGGRHLRLRMEKFGRSYDAVLFAHTAAELGLHCGDRVDAVFYPQINEFRNKRSVQLLLSGIRLHDSAASAALLRGDFAAYPTAAGAPSRTDFVSVWKALRRHGGRFSVPGAALPEALGMWAPEETVCAVLKIFEELGLLTVECRGGTVSVACATVQRKVDLESSVILRHIRSTVERCSGEH